MTSFKMAVRYMEEHLLEDIQAKDVASAVHMSPFYLQKGFRILTGYSIGEYIRRRRLYLAALELRSGEMTRIIDLAAQYGYDTPDSFTKAFRRFHGVTPAGLKKDPEQLRIFLPLTITVQVRGGEHMDMTVEKMEGFQVIGFAQRVRSENAYETIPRMWDAFRERYGMAFRAREDAAAQTVRRCRIGQLGICVEDGPEEEFLYLIAGRYDGGNVPAEMVLYNIPAMTWAKFRCLGPMPGALQAVNTKIFREWLPGNETYEIAAGVNIEWYSEADPGQTDYESQIWVPVKGGKGTNI